TSVTEQLATVALAGPRARDVLSSLAPGADLCADAYASMTCRELRVAGFDALVCRVSFSGELAFEVSVPGRYGLALWEALATAGAVPYGTEAMHVLRAEKGYPIVGQETDSTVIPQDLGMRCKSEPFLGSRSHRRPDATRDDRRRLVGLLTE